MMVMMLVYLIAGKYYERQSGWVMGTRTIHGEGGFKNVECKGILNETNDDNTIVLLLFYL